VPQLLEAAATGDAACAESLLPLVYDALRRIARARLRGREGAVSIEATALVHDAYLRMVGDQPVSYRGRNHFCAAAALAMRHVLVDHARRRGRLRRGGGAQPVTLATHIADPAGEERGAALDVLDLDDALRRLEATHARCAQVVTLRYFGGLTNREAADALGVGEATVERDWRFAKAWLHRALADGDRDVDA
jgi:RNA polymerase sigma factor (TIGR02999 family)